MARLPGISAGDFITKCSHLLTAETGNSSPRILTLPNAALAGGHLLVVPPWRSPSFLPPQASSHGKADTCLQSLQGEKKKPNQTKTNSASAVQSVRDRDRDNLLSQPPTGHGLGSSSPGRVPQGSCKGGSGALPPCAGRRKFLLFACSPRQGGLCCPPPPPAAAREAGAGERQTGDPEAAGYSLSRRAPGAWPGSGWAARKVVPGRAELQDSGAVPAPRGHARPLLGLFPSGERLGRALLLALGAAPAGPGAASLCGQPWRGGVSRQGAPASVTCR